MATGKRFYWMKLKESFMTSDVIDYFMSQPNGAQYVVLYQMLCLKTINTEGRLSRKIGEIMIPYDIEKIRRDLKWFSADTIRVALNLYKSFGLIYEDVDGVLVLTDHENLVGSETDYAAKKARQRLIASGDNVPTNVPQNVPIDNRDKDVRYIDIRDKDKDNRDIVSNNTPSKSMFETEFEELWANYPKKQGKKAALAAYERARRRGTTFEAVKAGIEKYQNHIRKRGIEDRYIKQGSTYFRNESWNDDYDVKAERKGSFEADEFFEASLARSYDEMKGNKHE